MTDHDHIADTSPASPTARPARRIPVRTTLIAAGLLGLGVAGGATAVQLAGPRIEIAPANPVVIRSLADDGGIVTVRGKVAEIYGPMFVLADGSGRALVEGGRPVDGTGLVGVGQAVTVQGRFHHGLLHAAFLIGADGKVTALRPMGPPHGGPGGPGGGPRHGPHGRPDGPGFAGPDGPGGPDGPEGRDARDLPPPPVPAPAAAPATGNSVG